MSKIIFDYEGNISVMTPSSEALQIMTIEQIAEKDLPVGVSTYSIVEDSVVPTDRSFRNSWV